MGNNMGICGSVRKADDGALGAEASMPRAPPTTAPAASAVQSSQLPAKATSVPEQRSSQQVQAKAKPLTEPFEPPAEDKPAVNDENKDNNAAAPGTPIQQPAAAAPPAQPEEEEVDRKKDNSADSSAPAVPAMSAEEEQDVLESFDIMEHENKGFVRVEEVRMLLPEVNDTLSTDAIEKFIQTADPNQTGTISKDTYVRSAAIVGLLRAPTEAAAAANAGRRMSSEELAMATPETLEILNVMDPDNTGAVPADEVLAVLPSINSDLSDVQIEELFQRADPDNTGKITRLNFLVMMRHATTGGPKDPNQAAEESALRSIPRFHHRKRSQQLSQDYS